MKCGLIAENGHVWCSGSNQYGQLAKPVAVRQPRKLATQVVNVDGSITHSCIPVLIPVQNCIKISSGWHHVVALGTPGLCFSISANSHKFLLSFLQITTIEFGLGVATTLVNVALVHMTVQSFHLQKSSFLQRTVIMKSPGHLHQM